MMLMALAIVPMAAPAAALASALAFRLGASGTFQAGPVSLAAATTPATSTKTTSLAEAMDVFAGTRRTCPGPACSERHLPLMAARHAAELSFF